LKLPLLLSLFLAAPITVAAGDASLSLTVPYLKQPKMLCGGAAATMVLRFWGEASADARQFEPFIDRKAGGIATDVLAQAVENRSWRAVQFKGSVESVRERLEAGQPVIVLTHERGERYHYVVVVGFTAEEIVVHDPARGPSRRIKVDRFVRDWNAAGSWSLLILPKP
jgi:ABC-type bacteriocin/lantibiotic exporter with double-glycine peptidase domain